MPETKGVEGVSLNYKPLMIPRTDLTLLLYQPWLSIPFYLPPRHKVAAGTPSVKPNGDVIFRQTKRK